MDGLVKNSKTPSPLTEEGWNRVLPLIPSGKGIEKVYQNCLKNLT
jgi:hypothetical protein